MKAEGGWAAVNTEFCSVHPSSDSLPLVSARLWDDDDVEQLSARWPSWRTSTTRWPGSSSGTAAASSATSRSRLPARSVSQMTDESLYSSSCYELDKAGIREIQGYYVDAAMRAVAAPASTSSTSRAPSAARCPSTS